VRGELGLVVLWRRGLGWVAAPFGVGGERGRTCALAEELAEVRGAGEAEACGDLRRRLVAVHQESFGLEQHPAVDVLLRCDARSIHARAGERVRGMLRRAFRWLKFIANTGPVLSGISSSVESGTTHRLRRSP